MPRPGTDPADDEARAETVTSMLEKPSRGVYQHHVPGVTESSESKNEVFLLFGNHTTLATGFSAAEALVGVNANFCCTSPYVFGPHGADDISSPPC